MTRRGVAVGLALAVGLVVVVTGVAWGQTGSDTVLDQVQQAYRLGSHAWMARLIPVAQQTFAVLAGIEVAISGLIYGLRRDALDDVVSRFVLKFAMLSVLLATITLSGTWLPAIVNGFVAAGEHAVGQPGTIDPSEVIDLGATIAGQMMTIMDGWGILRHPMMSLYSAICALVVFFSYVYVAAQLVLALVESYAVIGGGVIFLAGAASRMTAGYAEGFVNRVVYSGVKIFLLYLVVAIGVDVSRGWVPLLAHEQPLNPDDVTTIVTGGNPSFAAGSPVWQVIAGAVVFALLSYRIPNTVAGGVTARPTFGVANAMRGL